MATTRTAVAADKEETTTKMEETMKTNDDVVAVEPPNCNNNDPTATTTATATTTEQENRFAAAITTTTSSHENAKPSSSAIDKKSSSSVSMDKVSSTVDEPASKHATTHNTQETTQQETQHNENETSTSAAPQSMEESSNRKDETAAAVLPKKPTTRNTRETQQASHETSHETLNETLNEISATPRSMEESSSSKDEPVAMLPRKPTTRKSTKETQPETANEISNETSATPRGTDTSMEESSKDVPASVSPKKPTTRKRTKATPQNTNKTTKNDNATAVRPRSTRRASTKRASKKETPTASSSRKPTTITVGVALGTETTTKATTTKRQAAKQRTAKKPSQRSSSRTSKERKTPASKKQPTRRAKTQQNTTTTDTTTRAEKKPRARSRRRATTAAAVEQPPPKNAATVDSAIQKLEMAVKHATAAVENKLEETNPCQPTPRAAEDTVVKDSAKRRAKTAAVEPPPANAATAEDSAKKNREMTAENATGVAAENELEGKKETNPCQSTPSAAEVTVAKDLEKEKREMAATNATGAAAENELEEKKETNHCQSTPISVEDAVEKDSTTENREMAAANATGAAAENEPEKKKETNHCQSTPSAPESNTTPQPPALTKIVIKTELMQENDAGEDTANAAAEEEKEANHLNVPLSVPQSEVLTKKSTTRNVAEGAACGLGVQETDLPQSATQPEVSAETTIPMAAELLEMTNSNFLQGVPETPMETTTMEAEPASEDASNIAKESAANNAESTNSDFPRCVPRPESPAETAPMEAERASEDAATVAKDSVETPRTATPQTDGPVIAANATTRSETGSESKVVAEEKENRDEPQQQQQQEEESDEKKESSSSEPQLPHRKTLSSETGSGSESKVIAVEKEDRDEPKQQQQQQQELDEKEISFSESRLPSSRRKTRALESKVVAGEKKDQSSGELNQQHQEEEEEESDEKEKTSSESRLLSPRRKTRASISFEENSSDMNPTPAENPTAAIDHGPKPLGDLRPPEPESDDDGKSEQIPVFDTDDEDAHPDQYLSPPRNRTYDAEQHSPGALLSPACPANETPRTMGATLDFLDVENARNENNDNENKGENVSIAVKTEHDPGAPPLFPELDKIPEADRVLLSLPEHEGKLQERYYLTGLHYWVFKDPSNASRRNVVCRYCYSTKGFLNAAALAKSIAHLSLHFERGLCLCCPDSAKTSIKNANKRKGGGSLSMPTFSKEVWDRKVPSLARSHHHHPAAPKKAASKSGGEKRKRPRSSTTTKPRAAAAARRSSTNTSLDEGVAAVPPALKRPRRDAAIAAVEGMTKQRNQSEDDFNEKLSGGERQAASSSSSSAPPKYVIGLEKVPIFVPMPEYVEAQDTWYFCENGHVRLAYVYQTVEKYGIQKLKDKFLERGKPHRVQRIRRIYTQIKSTTATGGFDIGALLTALERVRGRLSLYSFTDNIHDHFVTARKLISAVPLGPRLMTEVDTNTHFVEETGFLYHDPKSQADCDAMQLNEEAIATPTKLPPPSPWEIPTEEGLSMKLEFDRDNRVLLVKFHGISYEQLSSRDLEFFASVLQRDDITVISEGLFEPEKLDAALWNLRSIQSAVGSRRHHKFKRFIPHEQNPGLFSEADQMLEGKISDFVEYIASHQNPNTKEPPTPVEDGGAKMSADTETRPSACAEASGNAIAPPETSESEGDAKESLASDTASGGEQKPKDELPTASTQNPSSESSKPNSFGGKEPPESMDTCDEEPSEEAPSTAAPAQRIDEPVSSAAPQPNKKPVHVRGASVSAPAAQATKESSASDEHRASNNPAAQAAKESSPSDENSTSDNPAAATADTSAGKEASTDDGIARKNLNGFSPFAIVGPEGALVDVPTDPKKDAVYMIDFDLPRILPQNSDDFVENFKMKEILPGGKWCMMNALPKSARPFMGPNMYITPGGAYTHFHQDGNGTVDSGHCCLTGFNEVVMLRRLPERHKVEASKSIPERGNYDALYSFPHENGKKPDWPKRDTIELWKEMGYCPSVFIVRAGQHVHINKGRLHAFRKLTLETLPEDDCHFELRNEIHKELRMKNPDIKKAPLCISVAWDWQYTGVEASGINREFTSALECQLLVDQKRNMKCLAIPRACLLAIGQQCHTAATESQQDEMSMICSEACLGSSKQHVLTKSALLSGIKPSLTHVLEENIAFIEKATKKAQVGRRKSGDRLNIEKTTDTALNPLASAVDPDGNDYFCRICSRELENVYLHCDGCEEHLQKDFNICIACHDSRAWETHFEMRGGKFEKELVDSLVNHTGNLSPTTECCCSSETKKPNCTKCGGCTACNCVCHRSFTVRRRFYDTGELKSILHSLQSVESPKLGEFSKPRLQVAADRTGKGYEVKRAFLKDGERNIKEAEEEALKVNEKEAQQAEEKKEEDAQKDRSLSDRSNRRASRTSPAISLCLGGIDIAKPHPNFPKGVRLETPSEANKNSVYWLPFHIEPRRHGEKEQNFYCNLCGECLLLKSSNSNDYRKHLKLKHADIHEALESMRGDCPSSPKQKRRREARDDGSDEENKRRKKVSKAGGKGHLLPQDNKTLSSGSETESQTGDQNNQDSQIDAAVTLLSIKPPFSGPSLKASVLESLGEQDTAITKEAQSQHESVVSEEEPSAMKA